MLESGLSFRESAHPSSVTSSAWHVPELRRSRVGHTGERPLDRDPGGTTAKPSMHVAAFVGEPSLLRVEHTAS